MDGVFYEESFEKNRIVRLLCSLLLDLGAHGGPADIE